MQDQLFKLLTINLGKNTINDYLISLSLFFLLVGLLKIFKHLFLNKLKKRRKHINNVFLRIFLGLNWPLYGIISLYFSIQSLILPDYFDKIVYYLLFFTISYYSVKSIQRLVDYSKDLIIKNNKSSAKDLDPTIVNLISTLVKSLIWIIAGILIISNLGYDVSSLIAGLGIGGIAIAFGLQSILSELFASLSIFMDKPFKIGDFIVIGLDMGFVKKIGVKSTRIQTLQGQELIISNKELTETRINNFKKMDKRRIVFNFGIEYETSTKKLKNIPKFVRNIIEKIDKVSLDRVHFHKFGDFSLLFEVVYYIDSNDYNTYMDIQQEINVALKEKFEKEKIVFAYPTQKLFLTK